MGSMLAGRVAVVTGAGRGIGRGVALALAAAGAKVVVNDYGVAVDGSAPSTGPAFDVVHEIEAAGGEAVASSESVADWEAAGRVNAPAPGGLGRLRGAVTRGRLPRRRLILNKSGGGGGGVPAVHLKGTFNCVRHACTSMREQRSGRIITFSSGSGLFGNPGQANYGAAKAEISGLTKVAARDLGRYGITVNAICPVARTRMTVTDAYLKARELRAKQGIQPQARGTGGFAHPGPDAVAPMVVYLASDQAAHVNGQFFLCYGGAIALVSQPRPVQTLFTSDVWTLDELERLAPSTVLAGVTNPAPPKEA